MNRKFTETIASLTEKKSENPLFSLALSLISLAVIISMLVGTTLAWLTESVTSNSNRIIAGNLDIAVNVYDSASKKYNAIADNSLFDINEPWEPDAVKAAYVEIKNKGLVDVDYSFAITLTSEKEGINGQKQKFLLSDYLIFNVVEIDKPDSFFKDNKTAIETCKNIKKGFNLKPLTSKTPLAGGSCKYYAIIVYMPSDDNVDKANYVPNGKPVIQLNVSLIAKQSDFEHDINSNFNASASTIVEK